MKPARSGRGSSWDKVSNRDFLQRVLLVYSANYRPLRDFMTVGPSIVFMLEHLKKNGYDVGPQNIVCEPCSTVRAGGFSPDAGAVTICQERILHKQHMEDTIMHELVHMYDHCKFKVDWNNLRHHACSEVCDT